jgi:hypothetical protein
MNDYMRGKIEACIELSDGDAEKFKQDVIKVTGLTDQGFHNLNMTDVAFDMLNRGEDLNEIMDAVL